MQVRSLGCVPIQDRRYERVKEIVERYKMSNGKKLKRAVKDLEEDTKLLELSKPQLVDKIRKLINTNKKLRKQAKEAYVKGTFDCNN